MLSISLGKSLASKDSEADGSHGSGTNTLYSNCWCDEKLESIPHKNSTAETPQTIRTGTPQEFFTDRLLGQLPQDDRTFYTVQFGLTAVLIQQLKAGKLDILKLLPKKLPCLISNMNCYSRRISG